MCLFHWPSAKCSPYMISRILIGTLQAKYYYQPPYRAEESKAQREVKEEDTLPQSGGALIPDLALSDS